MRAANRSYVGRGWKSRKKPTIGLLYTGPEEATKALSDAFNYWTQRLNDSSFNLSIAIVGGNWAAFGGVANKVLSNPWAKASLLLVVAGLAIGLLGAKIMGDRNGKRVDYAEGDYARWREEYKMSIDETDSQWPYTHEIDKLGRQLRWVRAWFPIGAGILFIVGLILA